MIWQGRAYWLKREVLLLTHLSINKAIKISYLLSIHDRTISRMNIFLVSKLFGWNDWWFSTTRKVTITTRNRVDACSKSNQHRMIETSAACTVALRGSCVNTKGQFKLGIFEIVCISALKELEKCNQWEWVLNNSWNNVLIKTNDWPVQVQKRKKIELQLWGWVWD